MNILQPFFNYCKIIPQLYYTYILYSETADRFYVGSTGNLERRIEDHKRGKAKYTRQVNNWQLKYFEKYNTRSESYQREQYIKRRKSRDYIIGLIRSAGSEHPV